ncbi:hypothetical protein C900_02034 [Fulvivirga imtechensis AK7]|uniref:Uncharacterized protein n=1 Tax=Fulvivirga imtechensis AK7 TaxID=1237149 RepID=L8JWP1_9BACT|nr:hypothetical protein C900_02034 [Fulvivirga imtechensis AK7]
MVLNFNTSTSATAVHSVPGAVTVRVYIPGSVTTGFWDDDVKPPGPAQLKVAPAVFEPPDNVTEVLVQLKYSLADAVAVTTEFNSTLSK